METFKYTIYILQVQQPVPRLKLENLMAQYTNETTQAKKFKDTENFFKNVRPNRSVAYFESTLMSSSPRNNFNAIKSVCKQYPNFLVVAR